jgi:hypothetical protein
VVVLGPASPAPCSVETPARRWIRPSRATMCCCELSV